MAKVAVFGTFDIFHPGHTSFLKQAKKFGDLIVIVARDINVKAAKGNFPRNSERKRLSEVRKRKLAQKVILGSRTHNFYRTLRTHGINILALGYDQAPTIRKLKKDLKRHRLGGVKIFRMRALRPEIYKSSKIST